MTSRNELEAAHARIESLEREKLALAELNAVLNVRLHAPPPKRAEPTPPPRTTLPVEVETDTSEDSRATWVATLFVTILAIAITAIVTSAGQ